MAAIFPVEAAKQFLEDSLGRVLTSNWGDWIASSLPQVARTIVDLHLDPENFAMPLRIETQGLRDLIRQGNHSPRRLREFMAFEDTKSIQGICRVMVRTHLNRSGLGFVSRGEKKDTDKSLSRRVLGPFETDFKPTELVEWNGLLTAWLDFAQACIERGDVAPKGEALFSECDIRSLVNLEKLAPDERADRRKWNHEIHNNWGRLVLGVHSGLNYLNRFYGLKADRLWSRIKEASQSVEGVEALMMEVQRNIREYGTALAGSFLADLGSDRFVKIDTHVKDAVAACLQKDKEQVRNSEAFEIIRNTALEHKIAPRSIDKIMYLGGSGRWYLVDLRNSQPPKAKREFLDCLRRFSSR
jgi:hypothetical protein